MMCKTFRSLFFIFLIFLLSGCAANLRYSQTAPDVQNFHPKRIAALPADVGTNPEAAGSIDQIVAEVLAGRGWFTDVTSSQAMKKLIETNEDFKKTVAEYTQKLKTVSFSDPDLSKKIGGTIPADAFLLVNVDYWNYAVEKDNKVAKAGLGMVLIDVATGKVVWKAAHDISKEYWFLKPALPDVARSVARDLISQMPH